MSTPITAAWRGGDDRGRPGWNLQFGYSETTIDALKRAVPADARTWDAETKTWWVLDTYTDAVCRVLPGLAAFRDQPALFY